jgi:hypothetical protein
MRDCKGPALVAAVLLIRAVERSEKDFLLMAAVLVGLRFGQIRDGL